MKDNLTKNVPDEAQSPAFLVADVICRLTKAQQREYDFLQKHRSVYVYGYRRRIVFDRLVELGLAENTDGGWHWFHLNGS